MTTKRVRTALTGGLLSLALSACGSTVQVSSTASLQGQGGDGLGGTTGDGSSASGGSTVTGTGGVTSPVGGETSSRPSLGPSASGSAPGATAPTASSGPLAGVSADQPIQLGIVLTPTASAASYGFSTGESYTEKDVDEALIGAINKKGGLAGHKIVPVYASTDPSGTNWPQEFAAACATFTQDHHVVAVLGYVFTYDQSFETCLSHKHIPHLVTGFNVPGQAELKKHPLHRSLAVPTIDVRSLAKLQGAVRDGYLTRKSKLGVALDTCPGTQESWSQVAEPYLKSHGISYITFTSGCSDGNNASAAEAVQAAPSGILKFRQAGVTVITFLTVSEGPALVVVGNAAESQGWHPLYVMSSLANLSTLEGQGAAMPQDQLANVKSYGWMPPQDVEPSLQGAKTPGQTRCLSLLKSSGVVAKNFGDFVNAYKICDAVFAYELAFTADGAVTAGTTLVAALDHLGTSFSNPDVLEGATLFGKGRENNAPARVRPVVFDQGCGCFVYKGASRPMP